MKTTNKYPYYEKDQVLSAQNLNDTSNYLEHQDLLTRRLLIGTGVACGLDYTHEDGVVTIVAGNGVTSMGYIIDFCTTKKYSKIRDYNLPDKPKYTPFYNKSKKPVQLWELCDIETAEGDSLGTLKGKGEKFIKDKVLVLFLEIEHIDLKNCIEGDCDDKGSEFVFKVVPLLIGVQDLMLYFSKDGDTLEDLNSAMLAKYSIKKINCPRFDVLANRLTTHEQIAQSFRDNINLVVPQIEKTVALMQLLYSDKLGQGQYLIEAWKLFKKQLEKTKKESESVQQAYNYLCTLASAINQFADEAAEWMVSCCPDIDLFPQHLALGELADLGTEVPKIFRNYFVYAPTSPLAHEKQGAVKFYFERVLGMLNFYQFGEEDQVKIIPSVYGRENLSDKAIPFYLRSDEKVNWNWLKRWNFNKSDYGRWKKNTYYYNTPETFLDLDVEPYSFFRIEGHIGKNYMDAISSIQKEIDAYRVPIKLVALSTGGLPIDANPIPESRFQDLEALFDAAKSELFCSLEGPLCFLSSISIKDIFGNKNLDGRAYMSAGDAGVDLKNMFGKTSNTGALKMVSYEGMAKSKERGFAYRQYIVSHIKGQFLSQKCNVDQDSFGSTYLDFIKEEPYKNTRLLELFQNQAGVSTAGQAKILLFILIAIDEIEELVALTKPATLSNFKFDELKAFIIGFRNFLNLFINLLEAYKESNDNGLPEYLEGITDKLKSLKTICSLKKIVTILNEHRLRTVEILEDWKFENFAQKHPGIEHKGGTIAGGTFIIVFHSTEEQEKYVPLTLDDIKIARTSLSLLKAYSVSSPDEKGVEKMVGEATLKAVNAKTATNPKPDKKLYEQELYEYAKRTGRVINQAMLNKFEGLFIEERLKEEVPATDGMVLFDFFLPYICCGDGGGVEYNLPEPKVLISLEQRKFCKNDENEYEFTLSPKGGQVTGPGLRESGDDYFFSPSKEDVNAGKISFSYVVQGRAASFSIQVSEAPVADFEYSIDSTPNGSYVSFTNKSSGAKGYTWKFGDPTGSNSSEENPTHYYSPQQENAKVLLIAKNDTCGEDVKDADIVLFTKKYEMGFIERDTFCENDKSQHDIIVRIENRGEESPLKGTVMGPGVKPPTVTNNRARFVPSSAGKGSHELTYEVNGVIEAKMFATVEESFNASFSVQANTTEFGLDLKITNIQPKGAGNYFWYMDPNKPALFSVSKTDDVDFSFLLDSTLVSNDKTFPIRLEVFKGYCSASQTEIVTNPFGNNDPTGPVISPFSISTIIDRQKKLEAAMIALDTTANKTTMGTAYNTFVSAKKLTGDMVTALELTSTQKNLLSGKSNAIVANSFKKELDDLVAFIPTIQRATSKKKIGLIARAYTNVYMSLMNVVFAQSKDLTKASALYKAYSGADPQISKAYKAGLTTKVKSEVKTLNNSAALESSKPNVSAVASANKTVLK